MVVILAAVLAYRSHLRRKQEQEEEEAAGSSGGGTKNQSTGEERRPDEKPFSHEEYYFQRAESFGRNSSEFLQRAAFGCTSHDTTTTRTNDSRNSSGGSRIKTKRSKMTHERDENGAATLGSPPSTVSPPSSRAVQQDVASVFPPHVRQEWINAVFGPSFFPPAYSQEYAPPRQGVGLSGIQHYVTYGIQIAPRPSGDVSEKVGVTLSKIALGVWVKRVEVGSEAYSAGVQEGSVLVDINGMGMLAEPSKQALERLWQYEGHFDKKDQKKPSPIVALTLIKGGRLYAAVFVSAPPFGISWAPCGNFPLVQRSYSFAQTAGLRKGCLVAAINQKSIRELDHVGAATELKEVFESGQEIRMSLVYTPAASRTGQFERQEGSTTTSPRKKKPAVISQEGVEVRVHPLEYSIGSFLNSAFRNQSEEPQQQRQTGVSELAQKVVTGQIEAPTGRNYNRGTKSAVTTSMSCSKTYGPCPALNVLKNWHAMDALVYCLRFYDASFQQDLFVLQNIHENGDG